MKPRTMTRTDLSRGILSLVTAWLLLAGEQAQGGPTNTLQPTFGVSSISLVGDGQIAIRYPSESGSYYILYSGSTVDRILEPVEIAVGGDAIGEFVISTTNSARFYRVLRVPLSQPADSDRDGMDDLYEKDHAFLSPFDAADAYVDFDMDFRVNLDEFLAGTHPAVSEFDTPIESLKIFHVRFDPPVRVGYGPNARLYTEALEFRLFVPRVSTDNLEPFLYVGGRELRGHKTVRSGDRETVAFYEYEPALLREGDCIFMTTDHRAALRPGNAHCQYRYTTNAVVPGAPLDDSVRIEPASLEPSPVPPWRGPEFIRQPNVTGGAADYSDVRFQWLDPQGRPVDEIQPGDSLSISFTGLPQNRQIQLFLVDDAEQEWSYARLSADRAGRIPETIIWFNTGVIGTTSRDTKWQPEPNFLTFEEAYDYWSRHKLRIRLFTDDNRPLAEMPVPIAPARTRPLLYPSNREGVLMNAVEAGRQPLYLTGTHFAPGSKIMLTVVPNRYSWERNAMIHDVTGSGFEPAAERIELGPNETSFTIPVWDGSLLRPGSYDLIARVVDAFPAAEDFAYELDDDDVNPFGNDTGVVVYQLVDGHIVMDISGRDLPGWSDFEFADVFERHEAVYGAVDPTNVPQVHPGGKYAAYYVVEQKTSGYWSGVSPALVDVSGPGGSSQIEIAPVKYWCINGTSRVIWPDPDPQLVPGEYDVVVDFGAAPAQTAGAFVTDATYDVEVDFIDGYNTVGFSVVDDPATPGPHFVGKADHYDANVNGGMNDPFQFPEIGFPMVRNWFTIRYPAQANGVLQPLPPGNDTYPVALFLHGRHRICACDDCAPSCKYDVNCTPADRVASHRGFNYLLDTLASQGFIAISIDAFDIQPSSDAPNYEARARLILEHLNRMESWNQSGTDPWGPVDFQGRIDMSRIAIVGHSRAGEAVVAAATINEAEPFNYGHSIKAVVALAPTDQQAGTPWNIASAPFLCLVGAADGDVTFLSGFPIYDRAYGAGVLPQFPKSLGFIHGANHAFFNTVWTPGAVGSEPCAFDDAEIDFVAGPRISDAEQRQIAASTIIGFIRQHLAGEGKYREIFTGRLQLQSMRNDMLHWSYQDPNRKTVEDFETGPPGMNKNTLNGQVTIDPLFTTQEEGDLTGSTYHDAIGLELAWDTTGVEYENELPVAHRDLTAWSHLSFRVMQYHDEANVLEANKTLLVKIEDGNGTSKVVYTSGFTLIPYPYLRYQYENSSTRPAQMKTVRLPLQAFSQSNSGLDLTDIHKIIIRVLGSGRIGLDDLQITR